MNKRHFSIIGYAALLTILLCLFNGCSKRTAAIAEPQPMPSSVANTEYAELLKLQDLDEGRVLAQIMDPWRTDHVVMQYLLVPQQDQLWNEDILHVYEENYGELTLLRTPLQRMTLTAGCHARLLHDLQSTGLIAVMCDTAYVMSPEVKEWLQTHDVKDGGTSTSPNVEVMMQAESDAVWISPFANPVNMPQLPSSLPIIYCADYMENTPLGRAEWMKFYGRLAGKGQEADSLFQRVSTRYDSITQAVQDAAEPPLLLAELPYGATWYVPGGQSTSARLYQDAGFAYPWADDPHAGSLSLSPESVLAKAGGCDVWYFKYMNEGKDWTREDFLQQNPYFAQFRAAKEGELWGCNTAVSDFFDITPFHPDLLLESLTRKDGKYFKKLLQ